MSIKRKLQQKYKNGELTKEEYDELLTKLTKIGIVGEKSNDENNSDLRVMGFKHIEGGRFGKVLVSGKLSSDGAISTKFFKVSGKSGINGDLNVAGETKISGKVVVEGNTSFTSMTKISGKLLSKGDVVSSGGLKVSGHLSSEGSLFSDNEVKISGKIETKSIKVTEKFVLSGKVITEDDIIAEEFIGNYVGGIIGGSLRVKSAKINLESRNAFNNDISIESNDLLDIPSIAKVLIHTFKSTEPYSSHENPPVLIIKGDLEGDNLELDRVVVEGDIIAENLKLGEYVEVRGKIRYGFSVSLHENLTVNVEKIEK